MRGVPTCGETGIGVVISSILLYVGDLGPLAPSVIPTPMPAIDPWRGTGPEETSSMLRTGDIGLSLRSGLSGGLFGFFGLVASSSRRITFRRSSSAAASKLMTGRILNDYVRLDWRTLRGARGMSRGQRWVSVDRTFRITRLLYKSSVRCPRSVYTFNLRPTVGDFWKKAAKRQRNVRGSSQGA